MESTAKSGPETGNRKHYRLCAGDTGLRLKLPEMLITLSDEGITMGEGPEAVHRDYGRIREIRLMPQPSGQRGGEWEAVVLIGFGGTNVFKVSSASPWGYDDPARDPVFVAFVEDLHERLSAGDKARIHFRRGIDGPRRALLVGLFWTLAVAFCAVTILMLFVVTSGKVPFLEGVATCIAMGAGLFALYGQVEKNKPGSYNPRNLPRDLFPDTSP